MNRHNLEAVRPWIVFDRTTALASFRIEAALGALRSSMAAARRIDGAGIDPETDIPSGSRSRQGHSRSQKQDSFRSRTLQPHSTGIWPMRSVGTVSSRSGGRVNWNTAPRGSFAAHNRPPWASMMDRQIASPIPTPLNFEV
jgi:hypothetical protein